MASVCQYWRTKIVLYLALFSLLDNKFWGISENVAKACRGDSVKQKRSVSSMDNLQNKAVEVMH